MSDEPKIDGKTMAEWIALATTRRNTEVWGQVCEIEPVLCSEIFGDGKRLAYIGSANQRPDYWVIRIDSKTEISTDDPDFDIEPYLCAIEEEFGCVPEWMDECQFYKRLKNDIDDDGLDGCDTYEEHCARREFPALNWEGGHFGTIANFGSKI